MLLQTQLKTARKKQKITQKEMGTRLGVSTNAIKYWETGRRLPKREQIPMICFFYHLEPNEVINAFRQSDKLRKDLKIKNERRKENSSTTTTD